MKKMRKRALSWLLTLAMTLSMLPAPVASAANNSLLNGNPELTFNSDGTATVEIDFKASTTTSELTIAIVPAFGFVAKGSVWEQANGGELTGDKFKPIDGQYADVVGWVGKNSEGTLLPYEIMTEDITSVSGVKTYTGTVAFSYTAITNVVKEEKIFIDKVEVENPTKFPYTVIVRVGDNTEIYKPQPSEKTTVVPPVVADPPATLTSDISVIISPAEGGVMSTITLSNNVAGSTASDIKVTSTDATIGTDAMATTLSEDETTTFTVMPNAGTVGTTKTVEVLYKDGTESTPGVANIKTLPITIQYVTAGGELSASPNPIVVTSTGKGNGVKVSLALGTLANLRVRIYDNPYLATNGFGVEELSNTFSSLDGQSVVVGTNYPEQIEIYNTDETVTAGQLVITYYQANRNIGATSNANYMRILTVPITYTPAALPSVDKVAITENNGVFDINKAVVGDQLKLSIQDSNGSDITSGVTYEWKIDSTIVSKTATYTVKTGDEGKTITVKVTGDGVNYTGAETATIDVENPRFNANTAPLVAVTEGSGVTLGSIVANKLFSFSDDAAYNATYDITTGWSYFYATSSVATSGTSIGTTEAVTNATHDGKYLYAEHNNSGQNIPLGQMSVAAPAPTTGSVTVTVKENNTGNASAAVTLKETTSGDEVSSFTGGAGGVYTNATVPFGTYDVYVDGTKTDEQVTLDASHLTATATVNFFTLEVKIGAGGGGTVTTPAAKTAYLAGSRATVTVAATTGYGLKDWTVSPTDAVTAPTGLTGSVTIPTTMATSAGITLTANFLPNITAAAITGNSGGSGKAVIGDTLGVTITTGDNTTPADGAVTYEWYVGSTKVGAAATYKVLAADAGETITVKVIGDGTTYLANATSSGVTVLTAANVTVDKTDWTLTKTYGAAVTDTLTIAVGNTGGTASTALTASLASTGLFTLPNSGAIGVVAAGSSVNLVVGLDAAAAKAVIAQTTVNLVIKDAADNVLHTIPLKLTVNKAGITVTGGVWDTTKTLVQGAPSALSDFKSAVATSVAADGSAITNTYDGTADGTTTTNLKGVWSVSAPTTYGAPGAHTDGELTFTPTDTTNYNTGKQTGISYTVTGPTYHLKLTTPTANGTQDAALAETWTPLNHGYSSAVTKLVTITNDGNTDAWIKVTGGSDFTITETTAGISSGVKVGAGQTAQFTLNFATGKDAKTSYTEAFTVSAYREAALTNLERSVTYTPTQEVKKVKLDTPTIGTITGADTIGGTEGTVTIGNYTDITAKDANVVIQYKKGSGSWATATVDTNGVVSGLGAGSYVFRAVPSTGAVTNYDTSADSAAAVVDAGTKYTGNVLVRVDTALTDLGKVTRVEFVGNDGTRIQATDVDGDGKYTSATALDSTKDPYVVHVTTNWSGAAQDIDTTVQVTGTSGDVTAATTVNLYTVKVGAVTATDINNAASYSNTIVDSAAGAKVVNNDLVLAGTTVTFKLNTAFSTGVQDYKTTWSNTDGATSGAVTYNGVKTAVTAVVSYNLYTAIGTVDAGVKSISVSGTTLDGLAVAATTGVISGTPGTTGTFADLPAGDYTFTGTLEDDRFWVANGGPSFDNVRVESGITTDRFAFKTTGAKRELTLSTPGNTGTANQPLLETWTAVNYGYTTLPTKTVTVTNGGDLPVWLKVNGDETNYTVTGVINKDNGVEVAAGGSATFTLTFVTGKSASTTAYDGEFTVTSYKEAACTNPVGTAVAYEPSQTVNPIKITAAETTVGALTVGSPLPSAGVAPSGINYTVKSTTWKVDGTTVTGNVDNGKVYVVEVVLEPSANYEFDTNTTTAPLTGFKINNTSDGETGTDSGTATGSVAAAAVTLTYTYPVTPLATPGTVTVSNAAGTNYNAGEFTAAADSGTDLKYYYVVTSSAQTLDESAIEAAANGGTTVTDQETAGTAATLRDVELSNLAQSNHKYFIYVMARSEKDGNTSGWSNIATGSFTTWYEVKVKLDDATTGNAATANGTSADATGVSFGVEQGTAIALVATPTTGWAFDKWTMTGNGTGSFTAGSATSKNATYTTAATGEGSLVVTANFVEAYTVAYNLNSGTGTAPADATYTANGNVTLDTGTSYTRTGYTFKGWALTDDATAALTGPTVSIADMLAVQTGVTAGGTLTLYAVWEANELTVTPVSANGTYGTQNNNFGTIGVANGTGSYTFTVALADGISIAADGKVSGNPRKVDTITVTTTVTDDGSGKTATATATITAGTAQVTLAPTYTSGTTNFADDPADKQYLSGTVTGPYWDAAADSGNGAWTTATVTGGTWDFKNGTAPTLTEGTNVEYDVTYTAPTGGTYNGLYGDKDGKVKITATAKTYELQVKTDADYAASGALNFTAQDYNETTVALTFDLKNNGNQPVSNLRYTITNSADDATANTDFALVTDTITGQTPAANGGEITGISVKPAASLAVGTHTAVLTILSGSGDTEAKTTVSLNYTVNAKSISTVAVTGVEPPAKGDSPDTAADDSSANHYTAGTVTWAPVNDPFAPGTVYTATVTVTPSTNYTFAADATYTFNGQTPASVTNGTGGAKVLTYTFPATGLDTVSVTAAGINQNSGKITELKTTSSVNVDFYYVITTNSAAPAAEQIIAGQDHTGAEVAAGMKKTLTNVAPTYTTVQNIPGLTAGETYYVHATALPTGVSDYTLAATPNKDDFATYVSVTVQVAAGGGGSVTPNTVEYVAPGGTVALTATPASGSYKFVSWAVDNAANGTIGSESVDGDGKATATLTANKNVVVTATFAGVPVLSVTGASSGGNEVPGGYDPTATKVLDGTVGNIGAANMTGKLGYKVVNQGGDFATGTANANFTVTLGSDNALNMTDTTTIVVNPVGSLAAGATYEATVWVYEIGNADTKPVSTDVKLVVVAADQPALRPAAKDWNLASGATNNDWVINVTERGYTSVTSITLNGTDIGSGNYTYAHTNGAGDATTGTGVLTIPSSYLGTLAGGHVVGDKVEFVVTMQWHDTSSTTLTTTKTITMTYVDTTPTVTGVSISPNTDLGSGQTLTATVTTSSGTPTGNQVTYVWYRAAGDTANPGSDDRLTGTGNTYVTTADDIGKKIYVVATGNGTNYTGEQTSALTEAVKATVTVVLNPTTGGSRIEPTTATVKVAVGDTVNIEVSENSGYKFTGWTVDDAANGAVTDEDALSTVFTAQSDATITANFDQLPELTGTPVFDYGPGATANTADPTVTYKLNGNTLDTIKVTKNGVDITVPVTNGYTVAGDIVTFIGSWLADNVGKVAPAIAANGSETYTVTFTTDKSYTKTVTLTLKNTMKTLTSVTIGGTAQVGSELTTTLVPTTGDVTYQWYYKDTAGAATGTAISGAESAAYTPGAAMKDKYVYVVATGTGDYEDSEVTSAPVQVSAASKPTMTASIAANSTNPMTEADVTFDPSPDKAGHYYYVVLPKNAAAPSAQQVKAGKDAAGADVTLKGDGATDGAAQTFTAASLTKASEYDLYLVVETDGTLSDATKLAHKTWFDGTVTIHLDGSASHSAVTTVTLNNSGTTTKVDGTAGLWTTGALDPDETYAVTADGVATGVSLAWGNAVKTVDYYTLTLTAGTGGTVKIDSGTVGATATGVFLKDSTVAVTAAVTGDYSFSNWTDDNDGDKQVSTDNPYTVTMNAKTDLTANFTENAWAVTGKTDGHVKTVVLTKQGNTGKTYTFTFAENGTGETKSVNIPNGTYTITVVTSDGRMMDWTQSTPNASTGTVVVNGAALPNAFNMVTKESKSLLTVVDDGGGQVAASSNTRTVNATFGAVTAKTYTVTLKNSGTEDLTGITLAKVGTIDGVTVTTTNVDAAFDLLVGAEKTFTLALASTAKVPGGTITFTFTADDNTAATYTFELHVAKAAVDTITITGIADPATGGTPAGKNDAVPGHATYTVESVSWDKPMDNGKFAQGTDYKVSVVVKPVDGYEFAPGTTATIGGYTATVTKDPVTGNVTLTFHYPATDVLTLKVKDVVPPTKNATPSGTANSEEEHLYTVVGSATWTPDVSDNSGKFKPNHEYTVHVTVKAATGTDLSKVTGATINGKTAKFDNKGDGTYELTYAWTTDSESTGGGGGGGGSSKLNVKYDIDSKLGSTKDKTTEQVESGAMPTKVPTVTVKDAEKNVFVGWTLDPEAEKIKLTNPKEAVITENTTFYAVFAQIEEHEHYIKGYDSGIFAPADNISRAQVAAIIARACLDGFNENNDYGNGGYSDVASDHWAASAIAYCTDKGVFVGVGEGMFEPERSITRQEFALVFARMAGLMNTGDMPFTDAGTTADWAMSGVYTAFAKGWLDGYADGTFKPWNNIARSEAVKIVNRYLNRGVDKNGIANVSGDLKQWPDVPESYWAYYEIIEASNDHTFYFTNGENPPEVYTKAYIEQASWGK